MVHHFYSLIAAFEKKLDLWKIQIANQNFVNFPRLSQQSVNETSKERYKSELSSLQEQFGKRFQDLRQHEGKFRLFSNPLHANLQSIPERFQNEVIELQSNLEASQAFNHTNLLDFYKKFIKKDSSPNMWKLRIQLASLFGSSYVCEQTFSKMNSIKSKNRSCLLHENLDAQVRLCSTEIKIDCEKNSKQQSQRHPSH